VRGKDMDCTKIAPYCQKGFSSADLWANGPTWSIFWKNRPVKPEVAVVCSDNSSGVSVSMQLK